MDIKSVEQVVSKLQRTLFKNSNSISVGLLKSSFKGSGLQFKEHQVYCHGDDVRFIDWKLLARTNTPYVKTFEEERNVKITVIVDCAQTMLMGYMGVSKLKASLEIACLLILLSKESGDYVNVLLIGEQNYYLPKLNGKKGVVAFVNLLEREEILDENGEVNLAYEGRKKMNSTESLKSCMKHLRKNSEVVLLSDFHNFLEERELKMLKSRVRMHAFTMRGPLDRKSKKRIKVWGKNASTGQSGIGILEANKLGTIIKNKFIDVDDKYLEQFVVSMN